MAISLNKEGVYSGPYWILLMLLLRSEFRHIKGILGVKETEGTFQYRREDTFSAFIQPPRESSLCFCRLILDTYLVQNLFF